MRLQFASFASLDSCLALFVFFYTRLKCAPHFKLQHWCEVRNETSIFNYFGRVILPSQKWHAHYAFVTRISSLRIRIVTSWQECCQVCSSTLCGSEIIGGTKAKKGLTMRQFQVNFDRIEIRLAAISACHEIVVNSRGRQRSVS